VLKRRDPPPPADNGHRKHFGNGIIPLLLCKMPAFCCGGILSLQAATRYELSALELLGGNFMLESLAAWRPQALSLLRIITGLLIIQHGMAKIIGFPVVATFANLNPMSLIGAAGFIELIGGALLILGLFTRPVAFILAGEMAFAYFIGHFPKGFHPLINGGTLAILYCFTCLYLSTAGAGPWSVDAANKRA
jgi:putative oxidoreductase